jgi:hypothetical protein
VNLRLVSVSVALVLAAMLLGAGVYESVAVAPNFHGAPTSLEHARGFYHATNPGMFFRVLSPATQLFLLLALICNWKRSGTRWSAGAGDFRGRDHVQISLSAECHSVWRSFDESGDRL